MRDDEAIERLACASGAPRASVILLHGYSARGLVHRGDGRAFVDDSTEVLLPDAPHHGARDDGRLNEIQSLPDELRRAAIYDIAREWSRELPSLAASCRQRGAARIAVVGISMGGFAALAALHHPTPFAAVAAVLAAPELVNVGKIQPGRPPLLLGLAGKDEAVPPESSRRFAASYGAELHEYPESDHLMRQEDWLDMWGWTVAFARRHLSGGM
ncbi:MAG: alpha/beta hydrolase [Planctomycetota bacterium]